jgi:hypothetical protein
MVSASFISCTKQSVVSTYGSGFFGKSWFFGGFFFASATSGFPPVTFRRFARPHRQRPLSTAQARPFLRAVTRLAIETGGSVTQSSFHTSRAADVSRETLVRPQALTAVEGRRSKRHFDVWFPVRQIPRGATLQRRVREGCSLTRARASTLLSIRCHVAGADPSDRATPRGGLVPRRRAPEGIACSEENTLYFRFCGLSLALVRLCFQTPRDASGSVCPTSVQETSATF